EIRSNASATSAGVKSQLSLGELAAEELEQDFRIRTTKPVGFGHLRFLITFSASHFSSPQSRSARHCVLPRSHPRRPNPTGRCHVVPESRSAQPSPRSRRLTDRAESSLTREVPVPLPAT